MAHGWAHTMCGDMLSYTLRTYSHYFRIYLISRSSARLKQSRFHRQPHSSRGLLNSRSFSHSSVLTRLHVCVTRFEHVLGLSHFGISGTSPIRHLSAPYGLPMSRSGFEQFNSVYSVLSRSGTTPFAFATIS